MRTAGYFPFEGRRGAHVVMVLMGEDNAGDVGSIDAMVFQLRFDGREGADKATVDEDAVSLILQQNRMDWFLRYIVGRGNCKHGNLSVHESSCLHHGIWIM